MSAFRQNESFRDQDHILTFLADNIAGRGTPQLAGVEEEILLLDRQGKPVGHAAFQSFLTDLMEALPEGALQQGKSINGAVIPALEGSFAQGWVRPETNTTLIEFAHAPADNVWRIFAQSRNFTDILSQVAARRDMVIIGAGVIPTVPWQAFHCGEDPTVIPNADFSYSWGHMQAGTRPEYCRTVFGTASVHHNMGFNDPELMAAYTATTIRMQPMMIALLGNSPLWNLEASTDERGTPLLSHRSQVQIDYGTLFGMEGVRYLYPDHLLDPQASFASIVRGYLNMPLDRTIAEGKKVSCQQNMTMADYLRDGLAVENRIVYPGEAAVTMMFREPICDVRVSMTGAAPRVETRAHDCVSQPIAVAIDALYRGVLVNLDETRELMNGMASDEVRRQRREVCSRGLKMPIDHRQGIATMQDLAKEVLKLAAAGLCARGLDEDVLLAPLRVIAETGVNPAERLLNVWKPGAAASELLRRQAYDRRAFADDVGYSWPDKEPATFARQTPAAQCAL